MKYCLSFFCCLLFCSIALALPSKNAGLLIAPGTLEEHSVAVLWDKVEGLDKYEYRLYLNGKQASITSKTNLVLDQLQAATKYTLELLVLQNGKETRLGQLSFSTPSQGKRYSIIDFGAKADSQFLNTKAIQTAIDACTPGGTVVIPKGIFVSGALFLKSNMTLLIEKGATLKGSKSLEDYLPMIWNRFEGWELNTYASLLNAGKLDKKGGYAAKNIRIEGEGTLSGGGKILGDAMIKANGLRSRGRLICLMNCQDVSISGITVTEPPSWTIHYIYSDRISCHDLTIITHNIRNGDGIDPDSSTDSYIFNCSFDTGDDCIAIKSGKNPEGFYIGKPTIGVRISDCHFIRGHGISIGSEMSGGVSNVLVQDCKAGALLHGMQIKGTKDRGGYVKNVTVTDCQLMKITIFSNVNYNNDGEPAPSLPVFENFLFKNIDLSLALEKEPAININGFKDPAHRLKNVRFENIKTADKASIVVNDAAAIQFIKVVSSTGIKPSYSINNSVEVDH